MDLKKYIRTVPNFPNDGIMFRDVTTLFNNASAFEKVVSKYKYLWREDKVEAIAGIDTRGFIIDVPDLGGAKKLEGSGIKVKSILAFEGE